MGRGRGKFKLHPDARLTILSKLQEGRTGVSVWSSETLRRETMSGHYDGSTQTDELVAENIRLRGVVREQGEFIQSLKEMIRDFVYTDPGVSLGELRRRQRAAYGGR